MSVMLLKLKNGWSFNLSYELLKIIGALGLDLIELSQLIVSGLILPGNRTTSLQGLARGAKEDSCKLKDKKFMLLI